MQGEVGRTSSGGDVSKEESPSKFALKGPAIPRLSLVVGGSKEEDLGSGSKTTRRGGNRKNFAQNFLTFRKRNTRGAADDMSALMMPLVVSVSEVSETSVLFAVTTASSVVSFRVRIRISDTTKKKGGEDGEGNGGQWKWYNRDTQELVDSTKEGGKTKLLEDVAPSEDETLSCFDYPGSRDAVPVGGLKGGVGYEVLIIGRTQRGESIHSPTVFFMTVEKKKEEDRGGGGEEGENCGKTMERRKSKRNLTKTFSKKELVKMKKDLDTEEDEGGAVDGIGGEGGDRGVPEVTGVQKILMTAKEDRERFYFYFVFCFLFFCFFVFLFVFLFFCFFVFLFFIFCFLFFIFYFLFFIFYFLFFIFYFLFFIFYFLFFIFYFLFFIFYFLFFIFYFLFFIFYFLFFIFYFLFFIFYFLFFIFYFLFFIFYFLFCLSLRLPLLLSLSPSLLTTPKTG